ncbi:MAG: 2-oxoacid:acceptor oxidoreductase subunit alpha [Deltaproteobacteria bacterium]|nr:2-oxoacid:acceptor oxidoreductase subunit alpha [Deltaproteobacteria bacterium]MBW2361246.1 2-oxoacid:acceptor oxidoreductase subunit alpha [Deltaproteobacteria bacterium]
MATDSGPGSAPKNVLHLDEHTLEIVSDSGEGAQKCGQIFASVSAKMNYGVWTVEIIPAEIEPPARTAAGASGNLIRFGRDKVTNWGDETNLVVAFNEQVLLARHRLDALSDDCIILIESKWAEDPDAEIRQEWQDAMEEISDRNYRVIPVPMEEQCLTRVDNPRKGKNMFALGLLAQIYGYDVEKISEQIRAQFAKKPPEVSKANVDLLELGVHWAQENLDLRIEVPRIETDEKRVVMNGNQAAALGAIASGMEFCAMYPITPATSVSQYLCDVFERYGGTMHQAEDEIAAAGAAIGASYAGKVALTVTSGPGLALKTEFIALAVMTEIPLVVLDVQRGGPSTGLPTKVEQSDLLAALFSQPGDAPRVVMAPATIEECFHSMVTARRIAKSFRCVVIVLTDANLASGQQQFQRPVLDERWHAAPANHRAVTSGERPYDWDPDTGLSRRIVPGQPGGMHTVTGLNHDHDSNVDYTPEINQLGCAMRSRKLAVLQQTMSPPPIHGDESGELLVVGWGSTKGAIEEAVDRVRAEGHAVSSTHLTFLSPMQPGLGEIFSRFEHVMTVELNYSDDPAAPYITPENRRLGQLAFLLRAQTLVDVDCWTRVPGQPLRPGHIADALRRKLSAASETEVRVNE